VSPVLRVVAVGERARVEGFALAGVEVVVAEHPDEVRAAVAGLDEDVAVLLLTPLAAGAVRPSDGAPSSADVRPGRPLPVVMPA
jgi:vacuolar-type H+-ATPase subunit F/Vma7